MKNPWKSLPEGTRDLILCVLIAALAVTITLSLTGCAGLPRTLYDVDPVTGDQTPVQEVPYYVPGTDVELFSAAPAGPGEGGGGTDWLTIGLQVVGALTGTSGLLAALSPAGREAWAAVGDPNNRWTTTAKALGNVATFGVVPPPKPAEPPAATGA